MLNKKIEGQEFAQPVSPEDSPLEDNSEELQKQTLEESQKEQKINLKTYYQAAIGMVVSYILLVIIDTRFFTNLSGGKYLTISLPYFQIGLSIIVTLMIFRKNKGNLALRLILISAYVIVMTIVSYLAMNFFMKGESIVYLVVAIQVIISVYFVFRIVTLRFVESEEEMEKKIIIGDKLDC